MKKGKKNIIVILYDDPSTLKENITSKKKHLYSYIDNIAIKKKWKRYITFSCVLLSMSSMYHVFMYSFDSMRMSQGCSGYIQRINRKYILLLKVVEKILIWRESVF